jgi:prepilin-type N-terminal cleavage/methylation domain-containing protein
MPTLARPPVREARLNTRQAANRAFTLIELLMVIGIIAILAAITFGVVKGVNERAAIRQAQTELSSLSQALEAYKLQYGDYPQAGTGAAAPNATTAGTSTTQYVLFNSLVGKLGPKGAAIAGKSFVEISRFTLFSSVAADMPLATGNSPVANVFLDPWGRQYAYYYKASATTNPTWTSYILLSAGPDGNVGIGTPNATTGVYAISNAAQESDNIYANR